jgi:hypothetical protein
VDMAAAVLVDGVEGGEVDEGIIITGDADI